MTYSNMYSVLLFPETLGQSISITSYQYMTYSNMYSVLLFPQILQAFHEYNIIPIYDVHQHVKRNVIPSEFTFNPLV
jgi:hypothetical protein